MEESTTSTRCKFMIGTEVIKINKKVKMKPLSGEHGGGGTMDHHNHHPHLHHHHHNQHNHPGVHDAEHNAWIHEILYTRRRQFSQPIFSANSHRKYSINKRRVAKRLMPTICEHLSEDEEEIVECEEELMASTSDAGSSGFGSGDEQVMAMISPTDEGVEDGCFLDKWKMEENYNKGNDENDGDEIDIDAKDHRQLEEPTDELTRRLEREAASKRFESAHFNFTPFATNHHLQQQLPTRFRQRKAFPAHHL